LIVVGIDPGTAATGYGVVARDRGGAVSLLECGVIRTQSGDPLPARLRQIHEGVVEVLVRHAADVLAVETAFYGRNVRTTVVLGHARAAAMLAAAMRDLPVAEYSPAEVKNAVTGSGRASKEQMQYMVQQLLRLRTVPEPADAADGVAVALCHCQAAGLAARLAGAR
jgi:crossover junction endodeoxyribonuclease RuvC